ncbi:isoaspartyl peptidase/L-asparaginase family protein [Microvirga splendida]|uniref:Isoaspartyl peptidase/L-asparaginase n=1 Tax=Microvirga splendida TaxID=2795727 RepID=A0ABS0XY95_9HYPH|nr:isoaspartyl peptidase/L-asparaginase [Microvirga splendida]MBJ6125042.1 isoaspartyl peptidase/L-asparaginase [Microvirga splendida]
MTSTTPGNDFALAIHGGAGTILRSKMTPEREAAYHAGLRRALEAGRIVLTDGGSALDAATAAVMALEDEPLFNAGRGAVYTSAGKQEMDAAVMDGRDRSAGAVAGICGPRNPVLAARAVMEHSGHVLLIGDSAMEFCRRQGLAFEEASYFFTEQRWQALQETLAMRQSGADDQDESRKHGTVGAVARDRQGNLAAATSTGGMTAKSPGRVGDSPVIGAGTWADNETCAISATGHGEIFIRYAAAHEIASRMRYAGQTLDQASRAVVIDMLAPAGGSGGIIAVDHAGNVSLPFNCSGMYRGVVRQDGKLLTGIYDEPLVDFQKA